MGALLCKFLGQLVEHKSIPAAGDALCWNAATSTWEPFTLSGVLPPASHHLTHENGAGDEISVAGLSGVLADAQTPAAHHGDHENGGGDELSVAGLSGVLADAQTPAAHHGDHENGGGDEIGVGGLSGVLADAQNADHLQGADVSAAAPNDGDLLTWNAGGSTWEPAAPALAPVRRMGQRLDWREDFVGGSLDSGNYGDNGWFAELSGAGAGVARYTPTDFRAGCIQLSTGTAADGYAVLYTGTCLSVVPGGNLCVEVGVRLPAEGGSGENYIARFGLSDDNTDSVPFNGVWFDYDVTVEDFWYVHTSNGGAESADETAVVWDGGWHRFRFEYNAAASLITFYIDDVAVTSINSNICAGVCAPFFAIIKTLGTTARLMQIDWFHMYADFAGAR